MKMMHCMTKKETKFHNNPQKVLVKEKACIQIATILEGDCQERTTDKT